MNTSRRRLRAEHRQTGPIDVTDIYPAPPNKGICSSQAQRLRSPVQVIARIALATGLERVS